MVIHLLVKIGENIVKGSILLLDSEYQFPLQQQIRPLHSPFPYAFLSPGSQTYLQVPVKPWQMQQNTAASSKVTKTESETPPPAINIPCLSNDDQYGGENTSCKVISRFLKIHRSFLSRSICQMLERKTTNIGRENEAETKFPVIVRNFRKVESRFCCCCCFLKKRDRLGESKLVQAQVCKIGVKIAMQLFATEKFREIGILQIRIQM